MITVSNSGKTLVLSFDNDDADRLTTIYPAGSNYAPGSIGFDYDSVTRTFTFAPAGNGRYSRRFSAGTCKTKKSVSFDSHKTFTDVPLFGKVSLALKFGQDGTTATLPFILPEPKPLGPRKSPTLQLKAEDAIQPETGPRQLPNGKRYPWHSEEGRQRSIAGLAKARAVRIAKAAAKKAKKAAQAFEPESFNDKPVTRSPTSNVEINVGSKVLTFNVPADELFDVALTLSERGYRVKENS